MRVARTPRYGSPDVLELGEAPEPVLAADGVLIDVVATAVTEGDRRLRAGDFPGFTAVIGRLIFGITAPRWTVQGTMIAGRVRAVGPRVTRYAVGDAVMGTVMTGGFAERVHVRESGGIAKIPDGLSFAEAAALPYGAGTAVHFLGELTEVQPGERVLLLGASGGVGRFAVSYAKHLGAHVTAVCSAAHAEAVRALGADRVVDYATTDVLSEGQTYDVIFDMADATGFAGARASLAEKGRFATVYMTVGGLLQRLWTRVVGGQRCLPSVAPDGAEAVGAVAKLAAQGVFAPVVGPRFAFDAIREAHRAVDAGSTWGTVIVEIAAPQAIRAVS